MHSSHNPPELHTAVSAAVLRPRTHTRAQWHLPMLLLRKSAQHHFRRAHNTRPPLCCKGGLPPTSSSSGMHNNTRTSLLLQKHRQAAYNNPECCSWVFEQATVPPLLSRRHDTEIAPFPRGLVFGRDARQTDRQTDTCKQQQTKSLGHTPCKTACTGCLRAVRPHTQAHTGSQVKANRASHNLRAGRQHFMPPTLTSPSRGCCEVPDNPPHVCVLWQTNPGPCTNTHMLPAAGPQQQSTWWSFVCLAPAHTCSSSSTLTCPH